MVPTVPVRVIEGHLLRPTEGYIPGSPHGLAPLIGPGGPLANSSMYVAGSALGPGLAATAINQYATGPVVSAALQPAIGGAIVWVGYVVNAGSGNDPTVFGEYYNTTETTPYYGYVLKRNVTSTPKGIALSYNGAGTYINLSFGIDIPATPSVVIINFVVGGAVNAYVNGASIGTATWSGGAPNYTGGPVLSFCDPYYHSDRYPGTISLGAFIYNSALSLGQIEALSGAPFSMLEPIEGPVWFPVSGGTGVSLYGRSLFAARGVAAATGALPIAARTAATTRARPAVSGTASLAARTEAAATARAPVSAAAALAARTTAAATARAAATGTVPITGRAQVTTTAQGSLAGGAGLVALLSRAGAAVMGRGSVTGTVPLAAHAEAKTAARPRGTFTANLVARTQAAATGHSAATYALALAATATIGAAARGATTGSLGLRAWAWVVTRARAIFGTGPLVTTDFGEIIVFSAVSSSVTFAPVTETVEF